MLAFRFVASTSCMSSFDRLPERDFVHKVGVSLAGNWGAFPTRVGAMRQCHFRIRELLKRNGFRKSST